MRNGGVTKKHVLIVEDEPDFAALLQSIFVEAGYTTAIAYNSGDALSQVRKTKPDAITLDMHMPRESGALFYRKLKKEEDFHDVPVVVVTGITRDEDMKTLVRSLLEPDNVPHPEAYVEKPVDGPSLLKAVEEAISTN